jgi:hydrogenase-4 component B
VLAFAALNELIIAAALAVTAALLVLGCTGGLLPRTVSGAAVSAVCLVGALVGLAALIDGTAAARLRLPIGPPGLSLTVTLDAISAPFLAVVLLCAVAAAALMAVGPRGSYGDAAAPALALAGVTLILLAADAVALAIGLAIASAGLWRLASPERPPPQSLSTHWFAATWPEAPWLAPILVMIALGIAGGIAGGTTGTAPTFAAISSAPSESWRATTAALLILMACLSLLVPGPSGEGLGGATRAGAIIPAALYLLIRLLIDLPGAPIQPWCGNALLLAGAAITLVNGWRGAGDATLHGATNALIRQYAGLAIIAVGLAILARSADLPEAAAFALAAAFLLALGTAVAGSVACLAGSALVAGAGTAQLARLGGLMHTMPMAASALAAALLSLSALPPGFGFAGIWLLFQALLAAPRTGGLLLQAVLVLASLAGAASIALAAASSLRLVGIALLGRPRSARASGAADVGRWQQPILLGVAALALLIGLLPGATLSALTQPAITRLAGASLSRKVGLLSMAGAGSGPGYAAIPVLALVLLAIGGVVLLTRRYRAGARLSTAWNGGQNLTLNLPFGDPTAQSAGTGFRPTLPPSAKIPAPKRLPASWPHFRWPHLRSPHPPSPHPPSQRIAWHRIAWHRIAWHRTTTARTGLWALLLGSGALLLVLSLFTDRGSP